MIVFNVLWAALAGFLAAIFTTLVEYPFWKKWGMSGVAEWQVNWVMISRLYRRWRERKEPLLSWTVASHISHGIAAGIVFRLLIPIFYLIVPLLKFSIVLDSLIYGIVLWLIFIVLPRSVYETAGRMKMSNRGILAALFSDATYGLLLGLFLWIPGSASLATF